MVLTLYGQTIFNSQVAFVENYGDVGEGGAMSVDVKGRVTFKDITYFIGNAARSGHGGAIYTEGKMAFKTNTYFLSNAARGEIDALRSRDLETVVKLLN